jgi:deazaflavin-dependent oxidoreductase (nitroreductase family)
VCGLGGVSVGGVPSAQQSEQWLAGNADVENCYLTTTGRKSGNPHEIEIWFAVRGPSLYLVSGNGTSAHWYLNLTADPQVSVRIEGETRIGRARPVTDPDERRVVGDLMCAKYQWDGDPSIDLSRNSWCYEVPAVAIEF